MVDESEFRKSTDKLLKIRQLNEESRAGLLFSYKALKYFHYDYQKALQYLESMEHKTEQLIRKSEDGKKIHR